jgi:hypothetical protein
MNATQPRTLWLVLAKSDHPVHSSFGPTVSHRGYRQ